MHNVRPFCPSFLLPAVGATVMAQAVRFASNRTVLKAAALLVATQVIVKLGYTFYASRYETNPYAPSSTTSKLVEVGCTIIPFGFIWQIISHALFSASTAGENRPQSKSEAIQAMKAMIEKRLFDESDLAAINRYLPQAEIASIFEEKAQEMINSNCDKFDHYYFVVFAEKCFGYLNKGCLYNLIYLLDMNSYPNLKASSDIRQNIFAENVRAVQQGQAVRPLELGRTNNSDQYCHQFEDVKPIQGQDLNGNTILHDIVKANRDDLMFILKYDALAAERQMKNNEGYTPLAWAAYYGRKEMFEVLLEKVEGQELLSHVDNRAFNLLGCCAYRWHSKELVQLVIAKVPERNRANYCIEAWTELYEHIKKHCVQADQDRTDKQLNCSSWLVVMTTTLTNGTRQQQLSREIRSGALEADIRSCVRAGDITTSLTMLKEADAQNDVDLLDSFSQEFNIKLTNIELNTLTAPMLATILLDGVIQNRSWLSTDYLKGLVKWVLNTPASRRQGQDWEKINWVAQGFATNENVDRLDKNSLCRKLLIGAMQLQPTPWKTIERLVSHYASDQFKTWFKQQNLQHAPVKLIGEFAAEWQLGSCSQPAIFAYFEHQIGVSKDNSILFKMRCVRLLEELTGGAIESLKSNSHFGSLCRDAQTYRQNQATGLQALLNTEHPSGECPPYELKGISAQDLYILVIERGLWQGYRSYNSETILTLLMRLPEEDWKKSSQYYTLIVEKMVTFYTDTPALKNDPRTISRLVDLISEARSLSALNILLEKTKGKVSFSELASRLHHSLNFRLHWAIPHNPRMDLIDRVIDELVSIANGERFKPKHDWLISLDQVLAQKVEQADDWQAGTKLIQIMSEAYAANLPVPDWKGASLNDILGRLQAGAYLNQKDELHKSLESILAAHQGNEIAQAIISIIASKG